MAKVLYVGNIPWSYTEDMIRDLFSQVGTVVKLDMIKDEQNRPKGFVFLEMSTDEEAAAAIEKFNGMEISYTMRNRETGMEEEKTRPLVVNEKRERPAGERRPFNRDRGFNRDRNYGDRNYGDRMAA